MLEYEPDNELYDNELYEKKFSEIAILRVSNS